MNDRRPLVGAVLLVPVLIWSAIKPYSGFTWFLEVFPVLLGWPIILATQRRFPLSTLLLVLLWLHSVILIVGGHYTYARVPLGEWVAQWVGGTRNNYDKLGHFAQGFVPAILTREILLRNSVLGRRDDGNGRAAQELKPSGWLAFLVVCVCLAFSALYELIEWGVAVGTGTAADDFLGTQGDVWDTQTDMALALVGAIAALLVLRRVHNRSLARRGITVSDAR